MARIYLCHRRSTASQPALMIANRLRKRFGQADVYINTGNPETSSRSILPLAGQLRLCRVMLVLIDRDWDRPGNAGARGRYLAVAAVVTGLTAFLAVLTARWM